MAGGWQKEWMDWAPICWHDIANLSEAGETHEPAKSWAFPLFATVATAGIPAGTAQFIASPRRFLDSLLRYLS
jgi:hypothetical protein